MITVIVVYLCGGSFYELIYVEVPMYISVMKVDAYYVPRSYIFVVIKHVMRACVGERVH